jgi:hypothetical protein
LQKRGIIRLFWASFENSKLWNLGSPGQQSDLWRNSGVDEMEEELVSKIKNKLQEYWVNELHLPIGVQVKSMAIIDLAIEEDSKLCHECRKRPISQGRKYFCNKCWSKIEHQSYLESEGIT